MNISHCFIKRIIWRSLMLLQEKETKRQKEKKSRRDMAAVQRKTKKELSEAGADESKGRKNWHF